MKRHSFDATSFLAGLVLGAIGLVYLVSERSDWDVDGRWVLPIALVGLGLAGIIGAVSGLRRPEEVDVTSPAPTDPTGLAPQGDEAPARPPA